MYRHENGEHEAYDGTGIVAMGSRNVLICCFCFQFLCLRNIEIFIKTCITSFGLKESDMFEALMLFDLTNFHKVLCTLSKLSLTPKAQRKDVP